MARDEPKHGTDDKKIRGGSTEPPLDSPAGRRPLSEDEKIDEAVEETFITSDPPAHGGTTGVGTPKKRPAGKKDESNK